MLNFISFSQVLSKIISVVILLKQKNADKAKYINLYTTFV